MSAQFGTTRENPILQDAVEHFTARAARYDNSSRWCTDEAMMRHVVALAAPQPTDRMLDVACGTGLVSRAFRGRVAEIVGLDPTAAMAAQAAPALDRFVEGFAEHLPFEDGQFDLAICRQGIQFMDAARAAAEMVRVVRPGGRVVLINLCAYSEADRDEYFEVLRLRNPARRNFFLAEDLRALLAPLCSQVSLHEYCIDEDIDVWADNGAIDDGNRRRIRDLYYNSSDAFRQSHEIRIADGKVTDRMLFVIAVGIR